MMSLFIDFKSILLIILILGVISGISSSINFGKRMGEVESAIKSGDFTAAKTMLDEDLSDNPEREKVYELFSDYYIALEEYSEAITILEQGVKKIPDSDILKNKLSSIKEKYSAEIDANNKKKEEEKIAREKEIAAQKAEDEKKRKKEEKEEKENFIASAQTIDWKELARNPEKYEGKPIKVVGEIYQIMSGGWFTKGGFRLYEDYDLWNDDTYLKKEWYVSIDTKDIRPRILEDDIVVFYGVYTGTTEVTRALTKTKDSVTTIDAKYFEIKE